MGQSMGKMSGGEWLEAFVSGWLFWSYFVSGESKKEIWQDIRAGLLMPVS